MYRPKNDIVVHTDVSNDDVLDDDDNEHTYDDDGVGCCDDNFNNDIDI